jgi:hypothetical protein
MSEPTWELLGGGGVIGGPIDYVGNWAAGVTYQPGQIVRYQGVDYLAVNPSTGQVPPVGAPLFGGVGLTLPASPSDGMEAILVDSLTVPTYSWRFRYLASITDAFKWMFIGGGPVESEVLNTDPCASAAYVDLAHVGPSFTLSRAGIYVISFGAAFNVDINVVPGRFVAPKIGAAATSDNDAASVSVAGGATNEFLSGIPLVRTIQKTVAAGDLIKLQYRGTVATSANVFNRWLTATPLRVS